MSKLKPLYLLVLLVVLAAFKFPEKDKLTVWLIGDSTMSVKALKAYPETGWGMPFANFFDSTVVVDNRAQNGRSTKSFLAEGLWAPVTANLKAGDFVFIQFGHNDEVKTKRSYTPEADFQSNLIRFINDSRAKKAIPVLITPVSRRSFDANGKITDTHQVYAALIRKVASEQHVPLIDLDKQSMALLQEMGQENSKYLFNHLVAGEHPNYPQGKEDDTHFNEYGARRIAELVLAEIRAQHLSLEKRIVNL